MNITHITAGNRTYTAKEMEFLTGLPVMPLAGGPFYGHAFIFTGEDTEGFERGHVYFCDRTRTANGTRAKYLYFWEDITPAQGQGAYELALQNGFEGTEQDWLNSLAGPAGVGVPEGGARGQVLAKASGADYHTEWVTKAWGGGGASETSEVAVTDAGAESPSGFAGTQAGVNAEVNAQLTALWQAENDLASTKANKTATIQINGVRKQIGDNPNFGNLSGIGEAPADGKVYGRKDGDWDEVSAGGSAMTPGYVFARSLGGGGPFTSANSPALIPMDFAAINNGFTVDNGSVRVGGGISAVYAQAQVVFYDISAMTNAVSMELILTNNKGNPSGIGSTYYKTNFQIVEDCANEVPVSLSGIFQTTAQTELSLLVKVVGSAPVGYGLASMAVMKIAGTAVLDSVIPDAPEDGKQYARKDGDWDEVVAGGGDVEEAPSDGKLYGRKDGDWEEVIGDVEEAPKDNKQYARKDGAWDEVVSGGGGGGGSNQNILHNWDFVNSRYVNQRGVSSVFSTVGAYFIDRWKLISGTVFIGTVAGLTINGTIAQVLEYEVLASVFASLEMHSGSATASYDSPTKTFSITSSGGVVRRAKLEIGSSSTLANDPPMDFGKELAVCQRYQLVLGGKYGNYDHVGLGLMRTATEAIITIPIPVTLRAVPALTTTGSWRLSNGGTAFTVGSIAFDQLGVGALRVGVTGSGFSVNTFCHLYPNNDATARIILDANL